MTDGAPRSALLLTPKVHGADGISAVTRLIVRALVSAAVETRVVTFDDEVRCDLAESRISVPVVSANGAKIQLLLRGLRAAVTVPDVAIVTHLRMLPIAAPLMLRGVPIATVLHGVECWEPLSPAYRELLRRSKRLLPVSRWTLRKFREANPTFQEQTCVVCSPGIPLTSLPETRPAAGRALIVGRLWSEERYKGHDALIDVWPAVRRACPHAHLMMVGDGDDRARLEARVRDAGLSEAIRFTGLVSQDALRQHFADAQVFVLPSGGEGFGVVFLEAMRAARPCIAAAGAAEEIVVDGVTGRVVPPANREALTTALVDLLNDPARCDALGHAGRQRLDAEFSEARFAERLTAAVRATCNPC